MKGDAAEKIATNKVIMAIGVLWEFDTFIIKVENNQSWVSYGFNNIKGMYGNYAASVLPGVTTVILAHRYGWLQEMF